MRAPREAAPSVRVVSLALIAVLLGFASMPMATAEPPDLPDLFGDVAEGVVPSARAEGAEAALRSRRVAVRTDLLVGPAHPVRLNLFPDAVYVAVPDEISRRAEGRVSWLGHIEGFESSEVVIVSEGDTVVGSVTVDTRRFTIGSTGTGHLVTEVDSATLIEFGHPHPDGGALFDSVAAASSPVPEADSGAVIDVMIVYTPAARSEAGGTAAIQALAQLAVDRTNAAYARSGITVRMSLVHVQEVAYSEGTISQDLTRLRTVGDGYLDSVHDLRNTHRADLVSLFIREDGTGTGGIANLNGAFSVVEQQFQSAFPIFEHESGHNLGAGHETGTYAYPYSHAYQLPNGRTTIMYSTASSNTIAYFSNPDISVSGYATGNAANADNARTIDENAFRTANYRNSNPPDTEDFPGHTITSIPFAADVDLFGASTQSGEPTDCDGLTMDATAWYSWTATEEVDLIATVSDPELVIVAVYVGGSVDALTLLGCAWGFGSHVGRVAFTSEADVSYRFQVARLSPHSGSPRFTFGIHDTVPPTVTAPSDVEVLASDADGAVVEYPDATASDDIGVVAGPTCDPPSGSVFPIGWTWVWCTATDAAGNVGSDGFSVTVLENRRVSRYAGVDRYGTAATTSWNDFESASRVFIATGINYPDALAGAAVAGRLGHPLLLVSATGVPIYTRNELERLEPTTIVILGGTAVVSPAVEAQLGDYADSVIRLAGANRFETAAAISAFGFPTTGSADTVVVATGSGFADALAGGPAAAHMNGPVLLTEQDRLPPSTRQEIIRLSPERIVVLGGLNAISASVFAELASLQPTIHRVAGTNRYSTAVQITLFAFDTAPRTYVATGLNFPDALAGAAAAAHHDSPVLLVPGTSVPQEVTDALESLRTAEVVVLGGTAAVSASAMNALD